MTSPPHGADFDFAERVIDGQPGSFEELCARYQGPVEGSLRRRGASGREAGEIVMQLWTDCAVGREGQSPLLAKYAGRTPLEAWLKTVAFRIFLDAKRQEIRNVPLDGNFSGTGGIQAQGGIPAVAEVTDLQEPLLQLLRTALLHALSRKPSSVLVMLQLRYIHRLTQKELADLWRWQESKVSRTMQGAMREIARDTTARIKEVDPWLDLQWKDFMELARTADFSIFDEDR